MKRSQLHELVQLVIKKTLMELNMDSALTADPMAGSDPMGLPAAPQADPMKQQKMQRDARKAALDKVKMDQKDLNAKDKIQKTTSSMWKRQKRDAEKQINAQKMSANTLR